MHAVVFYEMKEVSYMSSLRLTLIVVTAYWMQGVFLNCKIAKYKSVTTKISRDMNGL